jgi:type VI protein secretion system component Hcp
MYDSTQNLRRRVGPLTLVAALAATLAPASALAAPRDAGEYPRYIIYKMEKTLVTSRSTSNSFDKASPVIVNLGSQGAHFKQAELVVR